MKKIDDSARHEKESSSLAPESLESFVLSKLINDTNISKRRVKRHIVSKLNDVDDIDGGGAAADDDDIDVQDQLVRDDDDDDDDDFFHASSLFNPIRKNPYDETIGDQNNKKQTIVANNKDNWLLDYLTGNGQLENNINVEETTRDTSSNSNSEEQQQNRPKQKLKRYHHRNKSRQQMHHPQQCLCPPGKRQILSNSRVLF